jgi:phage baseplate assembly protein V
MTPRDFAKLLAPTARRLRLMASRAVLSLIDDAPGVQLVQVKLLDGEVRGGVERVQQYGFTSVPLAGAEGVFLSLGADRDHGVIIAVDERRYRLKALKGGEVAIYDDLGQKVHLTREGIVIQTPLKCRIDASDIELHASHSYSWDVAGFGERWTWLGGANWEHRTWQQGATVSDVTLPIRPPEGP